MICEICTRKCTRNARFHTDFGRFSCVFRSFWQMVIVYNKRMKPGDKTGLRHCSPAMNRGFRNNVGAKVMNLIQNLAQCGKNVA